MQLSEQQRQMLQAMGINPWYSRNNIKDSEPTSVIDPEVNLADSPAKIETPETVAPEPVDEPIVQAEPELQKVKWLIIHDSDELPDWWQKFVGLFGDDCVIAERIDGYEYQYLLRFSIETAQILQADNHISAPNLNQFEAAHKQQLWGLIKPWL